MLLLANVFDNLVQNAKGTASIIVGVTGCIYIAYKLIGGNKVFTAIIAFGVLAMLCYFIGNPNLIPQTGGNLLEMLGFK